MLSKVKLKSTFNRAWPFKVLVILLPIRYLMFCYQSMLSALANSNNRLTQAY